jgi:hypothetical protein
MAQFSETSVLPFDVNKMDDIFGRIIIVRQTILEGYRPLYDELTHPYSAYVFNKNSSLSLMVTLLHSIMTHMDRIQAMIRSPERDYFGDNEFFKQTNTAQYREILEVFRSFQNGAKSPSVMLYEKRYDNTYELFAHEQVMKVITSIDSAFSTYFSL